MGTVCYYTTEAVTELRESIDSRVAWYLGGGDGRIALESKAPVRATNIRMDSVSSVLKTRGKTPGRHDGRNALAVYRALYRLTPHQASDERLWTYISHNDCAGYVSRRWLDGSATDSRIVADIANHYFVRGNRGLIRDNGVSRLWWLGYVAHQVAPAEPERFLEVVLYRQDPRSALIERPSVSRNYRVLKAVFEVMKRDYDTKERALFVRDTFRAWMKGLNRQGGMLLLDALSDPQLERLVNDEATVALNTQALTA